MNKPMDLDNEVVDLDLDPEQLEVAFWAAWFTYMLEFEGFMRN